jgi:hypothetical protein
MYLAIIVFNWRISGDEILLFTIGGAIIGVVLTLSLPDLVLRSLEITSPRHMRESRIFPHPLPPARHREVVRYRRWWMSLVATIALLFVILVLLLVFDPGPLENHGNGQIVPEISPFTAAVSLGAASLHVHFVALAVSYLSAYQRLRTQLTSDL